jgi:hypothetical protein
MTPVGTLACVSTRLSFELNPKDGVTGSSDITLVRKTSSAMLVLFLIAPIDASLTKNTVVD